MATKPTLAIDGKWSSNHKIMFLEQTGHEVKLLKKTMSLSLLLKPRQAFLKLKIKISTSKGLILITEKKEQHFKNVKKEQKIKINFKIRAIATGEQFIQVYASVGNAPSYALGKSFYITVNKILRKKPKVTDKMIIYQSR